MKWYECHNQINPEDITVYAVKDKNPFSEFREYVWDYLMVLFMETLTEKIISEDVI